MNLYELFYIGRIRILIPTHLSIYVFNVDVNIWWPSIFVKFKQCGKHVAAHYLKINIYQNQIYMNHICICILIWMCIKSTSKGRLWSIKYTYSCIHVQIYIFVIMRSSCVPFFFFIYLLLCISVYRYFLPVSDNVIFSEFCLSLDIIYKGYVYMYVYT